MPFYLMGHRFGAGADWSGPEVERHEFFRVDDGGSWRRGATGLGDSCVMMDTRRVASTAGLTRIMHISALYMGLSSFM
jgi:hypothetical protein